MMPDTFANPWGFLALLAIPAILVIHLLREKSRRVRVSTLFLLERLEPRTPTGRTIQRLQNSVPLWLQLLIALLCTWLLVQPRWLRPDSRQRVMIVLDPSASMTVARPRIVSEMPAILAAMGKAAASTEWVVLSAHRPESALYRGPEAGAVHAAMESWQPTMPEIDPARALSVALLEARGGPVIYVSDRKPGTLPGGVTLLAFGQAVENCGFVGARTWRDRRGMHWEALVQNAGSQPQPREWWIETERTRSQRIVLNLAPGEIATVPGQFPAGENELRVMLSGDEFPLDDVLPLVPPQPRPLLVAFQAADVPARFVERVLATIPGAQRTGDQALADVVLCGETATGGLAAKHAVVFGAPSGEQTISTAPISTERHPLTEGAAWNGLLSSGPGRIEPKENDRALVWQKGAPLLYLREAEAGTRHLVLNFDFDRSNADRLPAVVLAVSRFLVDVQSRKDALLVDNFETNQVLPLSRAEVLEMVETSATRQTIPAGVTLRAPTKPGFFRIRRGNEDLLVGAARFGDPREGDFRSAETTATDLARTRVIPRENLEEDRWYGLWTFMVAAALGGSWFAQHRAQRQ